MGGDGVMGAGEDPGAGSEWGARDTHLGQEHRVVLESPRDLLLRRVQVHQHLPKLGGCRGDTHLSAVVGRPPPAVPPSPPGPHLARAGPAGSPGAAPRRAGHWPRRPSSAASRTAGGSGGQQLGVVSAARRGFLDPSMASGPHSPYLALSVSVLHRGLVLGDLIHLPQDALVWGEKETPNPAVGPQIQ